MKRTEFLRALLFLTLLPTIMFWPLVAILLGPDFVVPLYAALAWLGMSLVFTGLLVVRLVQSLVHQTKLVKHNWKGNIGKCPICDESFQGVEGGEVGRARLRHFESLHPEARKWNERWRILLILTWAILGLYMFILTVIAFHSFSDWVLPTTPCGPFKCPVDCDWVCHATIDYEEARTVQRGMA